MEDIRLSVVIAARNAAGVIATCLRALSTQSAAATLEVILADCSTDATPDIVRREYPQVRLLHFDAPLALPSLRGHGIAAARGAIIAILDPFSVTPVDWAAQVLDAHTRNDHGVIGGSVDLYRAESASYSRWVTYLNEYGLFMSPVARGATWILPGSNLSYKREVLFDGTSPRYPVFWKTFVNWELEREGSALWLDPAVRVELNKPVAFRDFMRTRYHHGRCFAGMRVADSSAGMRAIRAASTVILPPLLLWRWSSGFWPKGHHRSRFLSTIPAQLALFAVWSIGEANGYLRGSGNSCEQLYY